MFGTGKFNRMPFNVSAQEGVVIVWPCVGEGVFGCMVGVGTILSAATIATASLGGACEMCVATTDPLEATADCSGTAAGTLLYVASAIGTARLHGDATLRFVLSNPCRPETAYAGTFDAAARLDGVRAIGQGMIGVSVEGGMEIAHPMVGAGLIGSSVGGSSYDILRAVFGLTIPPGSTLVIDSENYVALLDGVNVIDKQGGDWLLLSRDTHDAAFDAASGAPDLTVRILYTERWL